jgi:hypothetical protein
LAEKVPQVRSLEDLLAQFMARVDMVEHDPEIRKFVNLMSIQVEWGTEREVFTGIHENNLRVAPFRHIPEVLALAREQGEIRPDVDLGQLFDILVGLFIGIMRNHLTGIAERPIRSTLEPALRAVFDSIRDHQVSPDAESVSVSR